MQGERRLAVTQVQAWEALNDPAVLARCVPGCDHLELTGPEQYALRMAVKIGPVSAKFSGRMSLTDLDPPRSYRIVFDGQGGAAGFGKGMSHVTLSPVADGGCDLAYSVEAQVGGKIAQVGQRLMDGVARSMADDFFRRFDQEMQARCAKDDRLPIAPEQPSAARTAATRTRLRTWAMLAVLLAAGALVVVLQ